MAGDDVVDANARRGPGGIIIPERGDLDEVAKIIADIALVPIEIVLAIIKKLEGIPKFLLVAFVLYEVTKREHQALRAARPRRR